MHGAFILIQTRWFFKKSDRSNFKSNREANIDTDLHQQPTTDEMTLLVTMNQFLPMSCMCWITRYFKDVPCSYTGDLEWRYHGASIWLFNSASKGLNSDEPHQGGIYNCGAERACRNTPHHEGPTTNELFLYMSLHLVYSFLKTILNKQQPPKNGGT